MTQTPHQIIKIRHDLKLRLLTVLRTEKLSPHMLRITLTGEALDGFTTAAHDDHMKLFFPAVGSDQPALPQLPGAGQNANNSNANVIGRHYTPRRFDAASKELDIDFFLHDDGPASNWAAQAKPGQTVGVGGPRGSRVVPADFDWYLLMGDETALPAIARRLEELPPDAQAIVLIEVADLSDKITLTQGAQTQIHWLQSDVTGQTSQLLTTLKTLNLPVGEGYAWIATELGNVQALRQYLLQETRLEKAHIHAASYWKRGASEHHQTHDE